SVGGTTTANSGVQVNPRYLMFNSFVQDDIKLTQRFTLNLGLRWELDNRPTENLGNFSSFCGALAQAGPLPVVASCVPGAAACSQLTESVGYPGGCGFGASGLLWVCASLDHPRDVCHCKPMFRR